MPEAEKDLQKENNRLLEKIDPRYKNVCEEFLTYIRINTDTRSREAEVELNGFLKQIIQAQREGMSIEQITGEDPKTFADDLIERLPKRNILNFAGITAVVLVGLNLIFDYTIELLFRLIDGAPLTTTVRALPFLGEMLITAGLGIAFIYLIFYIYRRIAFRSWSFWKEYGLYLLVGVGLLLLYILFRNLVASIDIGPSLEMNMLLFILLGVTLIIAVIVLLNRRK